jgi:carbamoyl-phosphate synthase small subunit
LKSNQATKKKIKLILEDGSQYEGYSFGAEVSSAGEIVFTTGMMGYPESLTDPSFTGQILLCTFPLVGNYGVPEKTYDENSICNFESEKMTIKGLIVSEYSENFNHWNATKSLGTWLKENKIPAITGLDTRAITQKLRDNGNMLAKIVYEKNIEFYDPNKENLFEQVSIKTPQIYKKGKKTIALIDCGMKNNILRNFLDRDFTVIRFPWDYNIFDGEHKFDGLFISNGPGDPQMAKATTQTVKQAIAKQIPIFGICLGLQILGLAAGAKTYKMKLGHRGQNQPVIDLLNKNRCYITTQNHGFAIKENTLPTDWIKWMVNANDNTIEGIRHKKLPFMAVQFHPENDPGPRDTEFLFDEFAKLIK